ncbi:MAG: L-2-hydroxyglutarate oxidase [Actinomycetota bacterium]|nr:MAG: L-2-hydroxyglutarate oxidase [Actinomycetota bacterium]
MTTGVGRVGVVGAGIIGLAVARELGSRLPGATVTVLEKEDRVAAHQTGHNSGVVHAGLYYQPGSLKARLCRRGATLLAAYCAERGLPYVECGKLVVAHGPAQVAALREIERRARENGVPGLAWLGPAGIADVEPNVAATAGLHSPRTAIVDYAAVARALAADVQAAGGQLQLGFAVRRVDRRGDAIAVSDGDREVVVDRLIVCAGLQADRVAALAGDSGGPAIIPFRGEYRRLTPRAAALVRGLVYPVPDPRYPFLGVHLTPRVDGTVDVGPNAVLATAREGYRRRDVDLADLRTLLRTPGAAALARRHWRTGIRELRGSLGSRSFLDGARAFLPDLRADDLAPGPSGVRAQAVDAAGTLVDDFRIGGTGPVVTVRNAPSPAATSALAIAEQLAGVTLGTIRRDGTAA